MKRLSPLAAVLALAGGPPAAAWPGNSTWPGTYIARLEATALLQAFNAELLSHDSATATLQRWCDDHGLAAGARITARRIPVAETPAGPDERQALGVGPDEPVRHRRVRLACGERVLSEADNWYLPRRLTAGMNRQLDQTDTPFGVVVKPLDFRRHTLSSTMLFEPLEEGWETRPPPADVAALAIPHDVLRHRAVLAGPHGRPFSLVVETYTSELLDIPARRDAAAQPGGESSR